MAAKGTSHEDFSRQTEVKVGSDRTFGFVFAAVFAVIGLWPLIGGAGIRAWSLGVAVAFAFVALASPKVLRPLNVLWFKFGLLLHKITNPMIMGLLFFVTITPIGLLMRALGKRPLDLDLDPEAESYWIERDPPGPDPESLKNQF